MSVKTEQFSVLISLYNGENEQNLSHALKSVLTQSLIPSEIIIVFDGPIRSELLEVVYSFMKVSELIRVIELQENLGLGNALNEGLKYCNYDLIARMDTDDICYCNRFELQIRYIEQNPNISVLGTNVQEFNVEPGDLMRFRLLPANGRELLKFSKYRNPLNHPSVVFRKSHVLDSGSYMDMPLFEDFYLWVRMLNKGYKIENLGEPLLHFRIGNDMVGRRHGIGYFQKELTFLRAARRINYISLSQFLVSIVTKLPLRLLPKYMLQFIYKVFLR